MKSKKVLLMILDGWGNGNKSKSDVIFNANTPFIDSLEAKYSTAELLTDGENVGLPNGQMGNSEVGHLNIGAGRVVYQDLVKINKAIADKSFFSNEVLVEAFQKAKTSGKKVHLMGLVSEGGVHSSQEHLNAFCDMAREQGVKDVFIHAFTDGRDTDPKSGLKYIQNLEKHLATSTGKIASVIGRYYAMDRDKRWERVQKAYDLLVSGIGSKHASAAGAIESSYAASITDEFIEPAVMVDSNNEPLATIAEGDVVICFNFRTDRCREITMAFTQEHFLDQGMKTIPLHYVTMTNYSSNFKGVNVVFEKNNLVNTLGEIISKAGKTQVRIAETEKYPHVTFFFSGGREEEFDGEKRLMVSSPKVATYDLQPEMSAYKVAETICVEMGENAPDYICLNFANSDMVGHTGVYSAIKSAVEHVDKCAKQVVEKALAHDYSVIVIADHGNADFAINSDGSPNTAHSLNPVPIIVVDTDVKLVRNGVLADVSPTILKLMNEPQPAEMTGESLV